MAQAVRTKEQAKIDNVRTGIGKGRKQWFTLLVRMQKKLRKITRYSSRKASTGEVWLARTAGINEATNPEAASVTIAAKVSAG